jgi:hypothetical protein
VPDDQPDKPEPADRRGRCSRDCGAGSRHYDLAPAPAKAAVFVGFWIGFGFGLLLSAIPVLPSHTPPYYPPPAYYPTPPAYVSAVRRLSAFGRSRAIGVGRDPPITYTPRADQCGRQFTGNTNRPERWQSRDRKATPVEARAPMAYRSTDGWIGTGRRHRRLSQAGSRSVIGERGDRAQLPFDGTAGAWPMSSRDYRLCPAIPADCVAGTGSGDRTGTSPGLGSAAVGPAERKCRSSGPDGIRERCACRSKPSGSRVLSRSPAGNL